MQECGNYIAVVKQAGGLRISKLVKNFLGKIEIIRKNFNLLSYVLSDDIDAWTGPFIWKSRRSQPKDTVDTIVSWCHPNYIILKNISKLRIRTQEEVLDSNHDLGDIFFNL